MKKFLIGIAGVIILLIVIGKCGKTKVENETQQELSNESKLRRQQIIDSIDALYSIEKETEKAASNWNYTESVDEMEGTKWFFAQTESINKINFEFPYEGGSYGTLGIRKKNGKTDVFLKISKGQFMPSYSGDKNLTIKLDEGKSFTASYSSPTDGSSDFIFIEGSKVLVNKIKSSKSLKLKVDFYQQSGEILNFKTDGLIWK